MPEADIDLRDLRSLVETLDHEVRSPLTLVYGWAEIVLDGAEEGKPADVRLLTQLNRAVAGVTELAIAILAESTRRIEGGKQVSGPDLVAIVRELRHRHGA